MSGCLWWNVLFFSGAKTPDQPLSCLCPLMGSQHPSGGLFSPMEVRTDHLPMCTGPNGTCPSGMVLHIKGYALHGLISHRDHSNVNHISSLILLNTCIKSLIHQSIAQRRYTSLQYKSGEKDKASYWASVHRKRKVPRETSSKPCKWMMWSGDVQACGCSKGQGCNVLPVGAFVEGELSLSWMHFFQAHSCLYSFYSFYSFICFFCSRANQGTLPWHGDQS
jgi:hypothetical protein